MPDLTLTSEPDAPPDAVRAIADGLGAFNDGVIGDAGYSPVRLFLRDGDGGIVGGLLAEIYLEWMYVRILWIAEAHRGHGVRRRAHAPRGGRGKEPRLPGGMAGYVYVPGARALPQAWLP